MCFDDISPKLHANSSSMFILKYSYLVSEGVSVSEVRGEQESRNVIESKSSVSGPVVSEEIIGKASGKFTAHSAPRRNTPAAFLCPGKCSILLPLKVLNEIFVSFQRMSCIYLSLFIFITIRTYDGTIRGCCKFNFS